MLFLIAVFCTKLLVFLAILLTNEVIGFYFRFARLGALAGSVNVRAKKRGHLRTKITDKTQDLEWIKYYKRRKKRKIFVAIRKRVPFSYSFVAVRTSQLRERWKAKIGDKAVQHLVLVAQESGFVSIVALRAFRICLKRELRRHARPFRIRVQRSFENVVPVTRKVRGARMGKGRGRTVIYFHPVCAGSHFLKVSFLTKFYSVVIGYITSLKQKLNINSTVTFSNKILVRIDYFPVTLANYLQCFSNVFVTGGNTDYYRLRSLFVYELENGYKKSRFGLLIVIVQLRKIIVFLHYVSVANYYRRKCLNKKFKQLWKSNSIVFNLMWDDFSNQKLSYHSCTLLVAHGHNYATTFSTTSGIMFLHSLSRSMLQKRTTLLMFPVPDVDCLGSTRMSYNIFITPSISYFP